ncbi:MAG: glycosyltransferase family 4 protein [Candidatus Pacebacteria bacterium]|nr:glycosyltransferase family 4 protein [Candidatus Paceibacterota bacterium]
MKILITTDSYFPTLGGAEVYAYQLATFLKKEGHHVELLTSETRVGNHDSEFPTHRVLFSRNPVKLFKFLRTYYRLTREADVVHSIYSHKIAAIGGILRFFIKKKVIQVISLQGRGILDLPGNSFFYARVHRIYRWISLKRANVVVASCYEFVDIAKRYISEKKIVYIPNLVDIEKFTCSERKYDLLPFEYKGQPLVFTIRRLVPKNGIQFLIESVPYILKNNAEVKFVLIGWGILEEYLKKRVKELNIEDSVFFIGKVENEHLQQYLNLADIVVFPSTAESTSIACLESMSLSKSIVASNVGGYPEMVQNGVNGFLVNLTDTKNSDYGAPMTLSENKLQSLAQTVMTLVRNPQKREEFGKNSRRLIEKNFTWQKHIKTIIGCYKTFGYDRN